jgi:hypothetical protein
MQQTFKQKLRSLQNKSLRTLYKLDTPGDFYLLFLATLVGAFTGFGAYLLNLIVEAVRFTLFDQAGTH